MNDTIRAFIPENTEQETDHEGRVLSDEEMLRRSLAMAESEGEPSTGRWVTLRRTGTNPKTWAAMYEIVDDADDYREEDADG